MSVKDVSDKRLHAEFLMFSQLDGVWVNPHGPIRSNLACLDRRSPPVVRGCKEIQMTSFRNGLRGSSGE